MPLVELGALCVNHLPDGRRAHATVNLSQHQLNLVVAPSLLAQLVGPAIGCSGALQVSGMPALPDWEPC